MITDVSGVKIPSRFLNATNDPAPGQILASPSGSIVQNYAGQLGAKFALSNEQASDLSDTDIGTLYSGIYQYVQVYASATNAVVRGQLAYWYDRANYIVGTDPAIAARPYPGQVAGVFLNVITAGNYGYIQVAGYASLLFKTTITASTATASDDLVTADGTTSPRGDILSKGSPTTIQVARLILGVAVATPTNNAISLIDLWAHRSYIFGGGR